jgi:alkylated DNA repair dioxygenase AlkB
MCAFDPCQLDFWDAPQTALCGGVPGGLRRLPLSDAEVHYDPDFLAPVEARALFEVLHQDQPWQQSRRRMYGRDLDVPRLQIWYGEPGATLDMPTMGIRARAWPETLLELKLRLEAACHVQFNAVLLNLYRDGRDSVAWHSDSETLSGPEPIVASLTLGASRKFMFRPKRGRPGHPLSFELPSGSLLVMGPGTQEHWEHHVPKTQRPVGPRINLTFRIVPETLRK